MSSAYFTILESGDASHIVDEVVASLAKLKGGSTEQ